MDVCSIEKQAKKKKKKNGHKNKIIQNLTIKLKKTWEKNFSLIDTKINNLSD